MSDDGQYRLETPENVELEFELAGPGTRFCAIIVDTLLQWLLVALVVLLLLLVDAGFFRSWIRDFGPTGNRLGGWLTWVNAVAILLLFAVYFGYYAFFEIIMHGQTPGKKYMKIRVIRDDGTPAGGMDIVVRNLVRMVDSMGGYAVGFFHPMSKRLGDLAAGTIVVKERELDYRSMQDKRYQMATAVTEVGNRALEPEERRVLTGFLHRRIELMPQAREELAQRLAKPLHEKYGGHFGSAESYLERLVEGRQHEGLSHTRSAVPWIEPTGQDSGQPS